MTYKLNFKITSYRVATELRHFCFPWAGKIKNLKVRKTDQNFLQAIQPGLLYCQDLNLLKPSSVCSFVAVVLLISF